MFHVPLDRALADAEPLGNRSEAETFGGSQQKHATAARFELQQNLRNCFHCAVEIDHRVRTIDDGDWLDRFAEVLDALLAAFSMTVVSEIRRDPEHIASRRQRAAGGR